VFVLKGIIPHQRERFRLVMAEYATQVALVDADRNKEIGEGMAQVLDAQFGAAEQFADLVPFAGDGSEARTVAREEQPRHIVAPGQFLDELQRLIIKRNKVRAAGEGVVGEERALFEVHVFPAGVEDLGLAGPGEEHQVDGVGRGPVTVIPEHVQKLEHIGRVQKHRLAARLAGEIGVFEGGVAGKNAPADSAVQYVFSQPEQTKTGTVGQSRQLKGVRPAFQNGGGNIGQAIRAQMRQDMALQVALVGLPAPLGFLRKGQIAFLHEVAEQRPGMEHRSCTVLLSDDVEARHVHPSRRCGKKVYLFAIRKDVFFR